MGAHGLKEWESLFGKSLKIKVLDGSWKDFETDKGGGGDIKKKMKVNILSVNF